MNYISELISMYRATIEQLRLAVAAADESCIERLDHVVSEQFGLILSTHPSTAEETKSLVEFLLNQLHASEPDSVLATHTRAKLVAILKQQKIL